MCKGRRFSVALSISSVEKKPPHWRVRVRVPVPHWMTRGWWLCRLLLPIYMINTMRIKKCYRLIKTITDRVQSAQCSTIVFLIVKSGNVFQRWLQDDWHECVLHLRIGPRTGHYLTWYSRPSFKKGEYYIGMGVCSSVPVHYQRRLWLKLDHFYLTMRLTILIPLLSVVTGDAFNECPWVVLRGMWLN